MDLWITYGIIAIGIFFFVRETFSVDTTSLLIMALFIATGVLKPEAGFAGFIHPATLILACMFVLSAAVFKSGLISGISGFLVRLASVHYLLALLVMCLVTALLSAFVNNTAILAIMIPIALTVSNLAGIGPSRLLMPLSISAGLGGGLTLVGTGTNLLISGYAQQSGLQGFGMLEFAPAAFILLLVGFAYLFLVAPWLLPKSTDSQPQSSYEQVMTYRTQITLQPNASDVGKTLKDSALVRKFRGSCSYIKRQEKPPNAVPPARFSSLASRFLMSSVLHLKS